MLFVWLNRILFAVMVALGVMFSLENRAPIQFTFGGEDYAAKGYIVLICATALGFTLGVVLTKLSDKANKVKHYMSKNSL